MLNGSSLSLIQDGSRKVIVSNIDSSPRSQLVIEAHRYPKVRIWSDVENDYGPWEPLGLVLNEWVRMKTTAKPAVESSEQ